jgi:hypothetical protein
MQNNDLTWFVHFSSLHGPIYINIYVPLYELLIENRMIDSKEFYFNNKSHVEECFLAKDIIKSNRALLCPNCYIIKDIIE